MKRKEVHVLVKQPENAAWRSAWDRVSTEVSSRNIDGDPESETEVADKMNLAPLLAGIAA